MKTAINTFTYARLDPIWPGDGRTFAAAFAANQTLKKGTLIGQISSSPVSEQQTITITGSPTGGTFTLTFNGQTTTPLAYNSTSAQVQGAVEALSTVGSGNVVGTGGALPGTAVTLTFQSELANQPQPLFITVSSLTGGTSPAVAASRTTAGVAYGKWGAYASSNSDGTQTPRGIVAIDVSTDSAGKTTYGPSPSGGEHGEKYPSAPVYYKGEFRVLDLVGLDSNALTGFARIISGSVSDGVISLL